MKRSAAAICVVVVTMFMAVGPAYGNTLIAEYYGSRVIAVDSSGGIVWDTFPLIGPLAGPTDVERLHNGSILIAEYGAKRVLEVSPWGTIVWQKTVSAYCHDAERLANGNTLITEYAPVNRIIEVDSSGGIVWDTTGLIALNRPCDVERLANGNTLITEYTPGNRVIEINSSGGIVWQKTGLNGSCDAERLANGNTLIAEYLGNRVIEVDSSGGIVWQRAANGPSDAERVTSGNTLITEFAGNRVIQVDSSGAILWQKALLTGCYDAERCVPDVWVDDDWSSQGDVDGYDPSLTWQYDAFNSIQDGTDTVCGSTVHVLDGTYGPFTVEGKWNVTIKAEGDVIVEGVQSVTTAYSDRDCVVFVKDATNILLQDLDIQGNGLGTINTKNYGIIYEDSSGDISGCAVSPNTAGDMSSTAIGIWDGSDVGVSESVIKNYGRIGILVYNGCEATISDSTIEGQVYSDINKVCYGIEVEGVYGSDDPATASEVDIEGNEIYNCDNTASPEPTWGSSAIYVSGWMAYGSEADSTVSIENNILRDNYNAIYVIKSPSSSANYNSIYNSRDKGVISGKAFDDTTAVLDASVNWWGTNTPAGVAGQVSDDVDYTPWIDSGTDTDPGTAGFQPDLSYLHVDDDGPQTGAGRIQEGIDEAVGSTVMVHAGTYNEEATLTPGKDTTIAGEGRDLVTWVAPAGGKCINGSMSGYTGAMNYEIYGCTFNCRSNPAATWGAGILINRASKGPLSLSIHDNRFIEDRASGDDTHWATSMLLCHNRYAGRDGAGNPAVRVYNNIDETWGGMTMSNSQAYDIYDNVFDGCSDAIYNGHGCPDVLGQTFGDHHIYNNVFMNAIDSLHPSGKTPAIDWQYYGAGGGTHLASIIENNIFQDNDTAMRFSMGTDMTYPPHVVRHNIFVNNGQAIIAGGAYASPVNAENNWWGDDSGPYDPVGTTQVPPCGVPVNDMKNVHGLGDLVSDNVDYCPWLKGRPDMLVITLFATNIGKTSATLWGQIVDDLGEACQYRFWYWTQGGGPCIATPWSSDTKSSGESFSQDITGLTEGSRYYFWAQAKNSKGESIWAAAKSFVTLEGLLELVAPNGGQILLAGSTYEISWKADAAVGDVLLEYSTDNGGSWSVIDTAANTELFTGHYGGSYPWVVPSVGSCECLVQVSEVADPGISDVSDDTFCIVTQAVPDVVGMSQADAESAITSAGFVVGTVTYSYNGTVPAGAVISQSPAGGTPAVGGTSVNLVISAGSLAAAPPTVMGRFPTDVGPSSAKLKGQISDDGGGGCEYRFRYWKAGSLVYTATPWYGFKVAPEVFSVEVTGLTPGCKYYYWAQAKNSAGEGPWSAAVPFVTPEP